MQQSQLFLSEGRIKLHKNSARAGHFTSHDCFGLCYILPNNKFFEIVDFFIINEIGSLAGFGPRAVVWRTLCWSQIKA